jgi:integrase
MEPTNVTKRSNGQGSVYLRNRIWWITFYRDGSKISESSGSIYRHDPLKLLQERQTHPADTTYTVDKLLDMLLQDLIDRSKADIRRLQSHLQHVRNALGSMRVVDVTEDTIERYQRDRQRVATNSTVNRECQPLGRALNKLAYRKRIISRPVYVRKLEENNARSDFFEPIEVARLITFLPNYLQDYTRYAYISGWRKNECATLTWEDYYPASNLIRLNPQHSKTHDMRVLPIVGELVGLIQRRQQERIAYATTGGSLLHATS